MNLQNLTVDNLLVKIFSNRDELGKAAAMDFIDGFKKTLLLKTNPRMVFAAAPSQNEFLEFLVQNPDLPWEKVTAFHMDEYLGLKKGDPKLFQEFLKQRIFSRLNFEKVNYMIPNDYDPLAECHRYAKLYNEKPIDMIALGIGENGHIAFNDPPFALFDDPETVRIVELEELCRKQQVNDGAFADISDVPKLALSLTIPALMNGNALFCIVPGKLKAKAVKRALHGPIDPSCPASILRNHPNAVLYLDKDSAGLVL